MFKSLPLTVREIKATEAVLNRIYEAARLGLKGDSLALKADLLPVELRRLQEFDPLAQLAEAKGRADAEAQLSKVMMNAALAGDAKVALDVLKHKHDWAATQHIQMDVSQQISILTALKQAEERVIEGVIIDEAQGRANGPGLLTNQPETSADGFPHSDTRAVKDAAQLRS
jgi:hypothetical protein